MFRATMTALMTATLCTVATTAQAAGNDGSLAAAKAETPKVVQAQALLELGADHGMLRAIVRTAEPGFFGIVLLSTSPEQRHFLVGLPPILGSYVVMGAAWSDRHELELLVPFRMSASYGELSIYGQALTIGRAGLAASPVVTLGAK